MGIAVRQLKQREEQMLVRHAEQLSKQEALLNAEKARYEALLQQKKDYEAEAYRRLGQLCFDAAAERIQAYSAANNALETPGSCCRGDRRSRSPHRDVRGAV